MREMGEGKRERKSYFLKFKSFLKKFSLIVKIKKIIWFCLFLDLPTRHINFLNESIVNNKKKTFDNQKKAIELLAINNFNEKYIVNSSDKVIGRSLYINGSFEFDIFLHTLEILENRIKTKTLVDVGANIGSICIPAIKRGIFKNSLAIEPEPYNFDLLTKNIFINNISDKIQTFNVALAQFDNQKIKFEKSEDNYGDHRIKSNSTQKNYCNEDKRKIIEIETKRLDTIMKDFDPKETLLWVDVQGYEGFVLEGGINTLRKKSPLVIEFEPYLIERLNSYNLLKKNLLDTEYRNCYNLNSKCFFQDYKNNLDNLYNDLFKTVSATNLLFFN
jgi:FkbM family methyltransferase